MVDRQDAFQTWSHIVVAVAKIIPGLNLGT